MITFEWVPSGRDYKLIGSDYWVKKVKKHYIIMYKEKPYSRHIRFDINEKAKNFIKFLEELPLE